MKGKIERIHSSLRCPVAILGDGISGRAAARLARLLGAEVECFDEKGTLFTRRDAAWAKVVVTSPGFCRDHAWLKLARDAGCGLIGELDFASITWPGDVIAVTGSNGKTTVTEFLTKVLREAGIEAVAAGNVGHPLSTATIQHSSSQAVAVCEVSSFQAESLAFLRPSAVLWTSFSEDHLDRHGDLREYFDAKANLARRVAPDRLFLGEGVTEAAAALGLPYLKGFDWKRKSSACKRKIPKDSPFRLGPQMSNFDLVQGFCRERGLDDQLVQRVARVFRLPGHRFSEPIKVAGVSFWNDSKATNFGAAMAACRHFTEKALWIGGGQPKGGDLEGFCHRMKDMVRGAYLIGSSAEAMRRCFTRMGTPVRVFSSLGKAVKTAFEQSGRQANVLFSPGFASFDQFADYEDRGKCFERAVLDLKKLVQPLNKASIA
ncbi:MAG: UDP-N-acetylmuramoyl-L-alanine--D-glutamate ligase [Opitutales bacterium]|jgi:UDP-N-acetylmuramoylalanine--D-glutamate ligase